MSRESNKNLEINGFEIEIKQENVDAKTLSDAFHKTKSKKIAFAISANF